MQDVNMEDTEMHDDSDVEVIQIIDRSAPNLEGKTPQELAEHKKEEGNKLYKQKKYSDALKHYTVAIELCPTIASYYGNRSACLMMASKYKQALEDAQKSIRLDAKYVKGYIREAKCHIILGDLYAARRSLKNVEKIDANNESYRIEMKNLESLNKHVEDADKYFAKKDYRSALYNIDRALGLAPDCIRFKLLKAEYLALLGRYQEALDITNDILRSDALNVEALYVRGLSLYYSDNVDKSFAHFQQVLRLSPDHNKARDVFKKAKALIAKKEEGNEAFKANKIEEACLIYSEALKIDPLNSFTNAKLYFNRSIVNAKRKRLDEAISDCTKAIELDSNYIKAYMKRAKLYSDQEMFEEAVRDYECVYKKEKTREHKQFLENAKLELKKSKRKDYYKILGISKDAGEDELKKAYKKRAMIHHPDRHSNATEAEKKEQEKKFKEVGEAYSVLSDPKKRARYDNGTDIDGGGHGFDGFGADFDPNNIFQAFFSGPQFSFNGGGHSGFSNGHGHGHGHGGHHGFSQHGFQNGFPF